MAAALTSDPDGDSPSTTLEPKTDQSTAAILMAIAESKSSMEGKIEKVALKCGLIRQDMDRFRGCLTDAKHRILAVEDTPASTVQTLADMPQKVKVLMAPSEDAENRLRHNNVRVVGLPEDAEGSNPAVFAEAFFKQLLGLQQLFPMYTVERAHSVPTGPRPAGLMPRAFLVHLLNFRDINQILGEAHKHPELRHENAVIHLCPDFSPDLQKKRCSFRDVRRCLEKSLIYNTLYPSRLKVIHHGSATFLESPAEAADWLDSIA